MMKKQVMTGAEGRCHLQSSLISKFEEIAQTFLNMFSGQRGNCGAFASVQSYLDGSELIDGAYCKRRTILLAIHDLIEDKEAPVALQGKTLAMLEALDVRPLPSVKNHCEIATAILRMEVVIRMETMQGLVETTNMLHASHSQGVGRLSPARKQPIFEPARKAPRHIPN